MSRNDLRIRQDFQQKSSGLSVRIFWKCNGIWKDQQCVSPYSVRMRHVFSS